MVLTLECIERREVILKDAKADLTPGRALRLLENAREADVDTGVTLIVGLDDTALVATGCSARLQL